jgi:hypothetical protein
MVNILLWSCFSYYNKFIHLTEFMILIFHIYF